MWYGLQCLFFSVYSTDDLHIKVCTNQSSILLYGEKYPTWDVDKQIHFTTILICTLAADMQSLMITE